MSPAPSDFAAAFFAAYRSFLSAAGIRFTPLRKSVGLRLGHRIGQVFTCPELLEELQRARPTLVTRVSVLRILSELCRCGLLLELGQGRFRVRD